MNLTRDFLSELGVVIQVEPSNCRVLYKDKNVLFAKISISELREKINASMSYAVDHYTKNVDASGLFMEPRQIQEASLAVVLHTLFVYNQWRRCYAEHKNHPLLLSADDLAHPHANDQCWFYCKKEFGASYHRYAAALVGMTVERFAQYEEGRTMFFNR